MPGKLLLDAGGVPLIARVYRNAGRGRETFIACAATFPDWVDALLPVPMVVDRQPRRGPLAGLVTTLGRMRSSWVFVVAGDAPFAGSALLERLSAARRPGDEAIVPVGQQGAERRLEPLTALYDRLAFLRAGAAELRAGPGAVLGAVERLVTRTVPVPDPRIFSNINTPADYAALRAQLEPGAGGHENEETA